MSIHVEWATASTCPIEVVERGTQIGEGLVEEPLALVLGPDPVFVIEGTHADLRKLLADALVMLGTPTQRGEDR